MKNRKFIYAIGTLIAFIILILALLFINNIQIRCFHWLKKDTSVSSQSIKFSATIFNNIINVCSFNEGGEDNTCSLWLLKKNLGGFNVMPVSNSIINKGQPAISFKIVYNSSGMIAISSEVTGVIFILKDTEDPQSS
jgi:hypothetical protein